VTSDNNVTLVQIGMRAAIRDIQEWLDTQPLMMTDSRLVDADDLQAYLLAMLFSAGVNMEDEWAVVAGERGES
jgi:outer membrane biogenesis lipoprotein LolB